MVTLDVPTRSLTTLQSLVAKPCDEAFLFCIRISAVKLRHDEEFPTPPFCPRHCRGLWRHCFLFLGKLQGREI